MSGGDLWNRAREGNIGEVQRLLRQGVDVNSKWVTYVFLCVCLNEFCVFVFVCVFVFICVCVFVFLCF